MDKKLEIAVTFIIIHGDVRLSAFMNTADVWSVGTHLGDIHNYCVTLKDGYDHSFENMEKDKKAMIGAIEQLGDKVIFAHTLRIKTPDAILLNNNKTKPYLDKSIRIVSNGKSFFMMDDFLKYMGIEHQCDEHRFITEIK